MGFAPKQEVSKSDFAPPLAEFKKLATKVPAATHPGASISSNTTASPPVDDDDDEDDEKLDQLLNLKKPAAGNQSDTGEDEENPVSEKGGWRTNTVSGLIIWIGSHSKHFSSAGWIVFIPT